MLSKQHFVVWHYSHICLYERQHIARILGHLPHSTCAIGSRHAVKAPPRRIYRRQLVLCGVSAVLTHCPVQQVGWKIRSPRKEVGDLLKQPLESPIEQVIPSPQSRHIPTERAVRRNWLSDRPDTLRSISGQ